MKRRSFLRALAASLAALSPGVGLAKPAKGRVVVVGAGISGLAAARTLAKAGWHVDVVEARARIGGRMFTDLSLGVPVDLGASWIHGPNKNPVAKIAKQLGIRLVPTEWESLALYDGGKREPAAAVERTGELWEELLKRLARAKEKNPSGDLGAAIRKVSSAMKLSARDTKNLAWVVRANVVSEYGAEPHRMSFADWNEEGEMGSGDVLPVTGFRPVVKFLAQGLNIHLSTPVRRIEWSEDGATVISDKSKWKVDACVVSVPLGVLKSGTVVFAPALPKARLASIRALEMGLLDKLALKFPKRFWPNGVHLLADLADATFNEWVDLSGVVGAPVLVALTGGAPARDVEALGDRDLVSRAMTVLRGMCGANIPSPSAFLRTKWAADPYALGSYSYVPIGAHLSDMTTLAKPLGALYFAGEATESEYFATVHGAYLSGLRAAKQVINDE